MWTQKVLVLWPRAAWSPRRVSMRPHAPLVPQVLLEVSLDRKPTIGEFLDKARSPRLPPQRVHAVCTRAYSLRLGSAGRMGRQGDRVCMLRD